MKESHRYFANAFTPCVGVNPGPHIKRIMGSCMHTHQDDYDAAYFRLLRLAYLLFNESRMRFDVTTAGDPAVDIVFSDIPFAQSLMNDLSSCTGLSFHQTPINDLDELSLKPNMNIAYRGQFAGKENILTLTAIASFLDEKFPAKNPYLVQALKPFLRLKSGFVPSAHVQHANNLSLAYCYNTADAIEISRVRLCGHMFNLVVAGGDLVAFNGSLVSTLEAMRALTLMEGNQLGLALYEDDLFETIGQNNYNGQWFIPPHRWMCQIYNQQPHMLFSAKSIFANPDYGTCTLFNGHCGRDASGSTKRCVRVWGSSHLGQDVNHSLNFRLCSLVSVN